MRLTPNQKETIFLLHSQGQTYRQIAETVGCSKSTVGNVIRAMEDASDVAAACGVLGDGEPALDINAVRQEMFEAEAAKPMRVSLWGKVPKWLREMLT